MYYENELVYVGKAESVALGDRIRNHREGYQGEWDLFSWFSIEYDDFPLLEGESVEGDAKIEKSFISTISEIEAIIILISQPASNRKSEKIKGAVEVKQLSSVSGVDGETMISNREYLVRLDQRLADIEKILKKTS